MQLREQLLRGPPFAYLPGGIPLEAPIYIEKLQSCIVALHIPLWVGGDRGGLFPTLSMTPLLSFTTTRGGYTPYFFLQLLETPPKTGVYQAEWTSGRLQKKMCNRHRPSIQLPHTVRIIPYCPFCVDLTWCGRLNCIARARVNERVAGQLRPENVSTTPPAPRPGHSPYEVMKPDPCRSGNMNTTGHET